MVIIIMAHLVLVTILQLLCLPNLINRPKLQRAWPMAIDLPTISFQEAKECMTILAYKCQQLIDRRLSTSMPCKSQIQPASTKLRKPLWLWSPNYSTCNESISIMKCLSLRR